MKRWFAMYRMEQKQQQPSSASLAPGRRDEDELMSKSCRRLARPVHLLVDAQHSDICGGPALFLTPLLQFDHGDVLQTDTAVDLATLDGLDNIHTHTFGGIVLRC